jgi:predicted transcriptional regulator
MGVLPVIRHRLAELGIKQRELSMAAQVTEPSISQLLTRKKAPRRTGPVMMTRGDMLRTAAW